MICSRWQKYSIEAERIPITVSEYMLAASTIQFARASIKSDKRLKEFYLRIKHKRGEKKAIVTVARKIIVYAYWILKKNVTYKELGRN